jgi:hypothetical protein
LNAEESTALKWQVSTCFVSERDERASIYEELGRFLLTLNCLTGSGHITVVCDGSQRTKHVLPFAGGLALPAVRAALFEAMTTGGGCEVRLRILSKTIVFGACLRYGYWDGCSAEQVRASLALNSGEIAVSFPSSGSVQRVKKPAEQTATISSISTSARS